MRISGNFIKPFGIPGIMWMHSHQAIVRSNGMQLVGVDGPGIFFTGRMERPVTLVDLRGQLRPTPFNAVTSDGVAIKAFAFISFQIDRDDWSDWDRERLFNAWRAAPILRRAITVATSPFNSYPYSAERVQAAISTSKINMGSNENASIETHWDEVAVQRVLTQARLVLSERSFDELWRPAENDERGASAIDEMTAQIVQRATPELERMGVKLFGARIVNFDIDTEDPVYQQLENSWIFNWDEEIRRTQFEGKRTSEETKMNTRMQSRTNFLNVIAGILDEIQSFRPNLLRRLTTLNFIATLERLLENVDQQNPENQTARIAAWGRFLSRDDQDETR